MIDDPDDPCPKREHRSVWNGWGHAFWPLARWRWPYFLLIPKRWRYVYRCIFCGERAR